MYRTAASLLQAKTHITTLSNGLRIATEASSKDLSSIVLRVACGSLHETPMTSGASSIASRMIAGCSPASRKLHEITTGMSASSKESTYYCVLGEKPNVFQMVELLIESMRNQMFLESDVHEQIEIVKAENRTPSFSRLLHQAAYWGALANPDYPLAFPGCLNSEVLKNFVTEHYTAPRMILWVHGAEHDDILSVAKPLLLDLPGGPIPPEPKSVYTGSDSRYNVDFKSHQPITQVTLAFEVPVAWHKMKGYRSDVTLDILKELLGGNAEWDPLMKGSKSPNYSRSRLCVRILNKYPQVHEVSALSGIRNDTGLFAIQVNTDIDFASQAIDLITKEFLEMATPGKVSQAELDCVKQSMGSLVQNSLEANMVRSMRIVDEIWRFGERITVEQKLKAMDEVTLTDIESLAGKLFSSPLTMLSVGKVANVPSYDSVSHKFHAK